jgi:DNA-binding MarR family transcriptional regulator
MVAYHRKSPSQRRGRSPKLAAAIGRLKTQIALKREFSGSDETAFLALVWTWRGLQRLGRKFFSRHGLTDAQFNVLMILWDYRAQPLQQHELADIVVVNRASIGSVLDRMERDGWVIRKTDPKDRRAQRVSLTPAGVRKLDEVREPYYRLLADLFKERKQAELNSQIIFFDSLRNAIARAESRVAKFRVPNRRTRLLGSS